MKKEKKKPKQNENKSLDKGITLIALVITIVVLIILAGISINLVLGENGLFTKAKNAAKDYKEEAQNEQKMLDAIDQTIEMETENLPTIKEAIAGGKDFAKEENKKITDGNAIMWLPKGFTVVEPTEENTVKYENKENPQIDEGIVVQDQSGNEFVWVPVINANTMYGTHQEQEGEETVIKKHGKIYNFSKATKAYDENAVENAVLKYGEPYIIDTDECDANIENLNIVVEGEEKTKEKFAEQLQNEFDSMIASVEKYKGFYIGRYETASLDTQTPIVQAKQTSSSNMNWYNMYANSKKIVTDGSSVTSSMIWGCQWDEVCNWFLSSSKEEVRKYVTNAREMGWNISTTSEGNYHYTGTPLKGENDEIKNRVKNIYDMAGNRAEWTMSLNVSARMLRGGQLWTADNDNVGCSMIGNYKPISQEWYNGTRATLYINL